LKEVLFFEKKNQKRVRQVKLGKVSFFGKKEAKNLIDRRQAEAKRTPLAKVFASFFKKKTFAAPCLALTLPGPSK